MSTSLFYHGFGRRGYQHVGHRYYEGAIHFHVSQDRFSLRCPACRSYKVQRQGVVLRRFRTVPIGVNLFRATAVRRASNRAAVTGQGPKSRPAQLIFLVKGASCKTRFSVILNEVKDLNLLKIRDSSLRSE